MLEPKEQKKKVKAKEKKPDSIVVAAYGEMVSYASDEEQEDNKATGEGYGAMTSYAYGDEAAPQKEPAKTGTSYDTYNSGEEDGPASTAGGTAYGAYNSAEEDEYDLSHISAQVRSSHISSCQLNLTQFRHDS